MGTNYRANYALLTMLEHLGPSAEPLDVPWAEFGGDATDEYEFVVPSDDVTDVYLELQAYDVEAFGHEVLINGTPLSGFDLPPAEGWQYWMDAVTEVDLRAGENAIKVRRDTSSADSFAVANVVVNWKEPVE